MSGIPSHAMGREGVANQYLDQKESVIYEKQMETLSRAEMSCWLGIAARAH